MHRVREQATAQFFTETISTFSAERTTTTLSSTTYGSKNLPCQSITLNVRFCFREQTWTRIDSFDAPLPRSGHSACIFNSLMLVFGGIHDITLELNDMHIFDFFSRRWIPLFEDNGSPLKGSPAMNMMLGVKSKDSNTGSPSGLNNSTTSLQGTSPNNNTTVQHIKL